MPTAISYIRFSSKPQEEGDSTRRQEKLTAKWMAANPHYELVDIRYDRGLSASKGKHLDGNLGKILESVEDGTIPSGAVLLVEDLSRFSRLPVQKTFELLGRVLDRGVDLITLVDNVRYTKDSINTFQLFGLAGQALAAYQYTQELGRKVRESYEGRTDDAKAGKAFKRRNPFWLTSEGKLKDDDSPSLVRRIFAEFTAGKGIRTLYRENSERFANPSSVRKLLKNIAVIGHWQRYDAKRQPTELIKNVFEPCVDEVTFYQVQKLMEKQSEITHPRVNPLAGIIVCAVCGGNYAKRSANAKNATNTMSCYSRMTNKESCANSKSYPMPVLGAVFSTTMMGFIAKGIKESRLSVSEAERVVLQGEQDRIKKRKQQLLKLGDLEDPDIAEAFAALKSEEAEVQSKMTALPVASAAGVVTIKEIQKVVNGDPIALTKTLQAGGYRIAVDGQGNMTAGAGEHVQQWQYLGYVRRSGAFMVQTPTGDVETTEAILRNGGSYPSQDQLEDMPTYYDAFPEERQYTEEEDLGLTDEELASLPRVQWGRQRKE